MPSRHSILAARALRHRLLLKIRTAAFGFLAVGLLLALIFPDRAETERIHLGFFPAGPLIEEAKYALLIGAILALTLEVSTRLEQAQTFKENLDTVNKRITEGISAITSSYALKDFPTQIIKSDLPDLVQTIATEVYKEYTEGLKFENGFIIDSGDWSLRMVRRLYSTLIEIGDRGQLRPSVTEIRVTHLGPPQEWLTTEANYTLQIQKRLVLTGRFKIIRVFVIHDLKNQALCEAVDTAIAKMRDYKIDARCHFEPDYQSVPDVTWVPDAELLMTWTYDRVTGKKSVWMGSDEGQKGDLEEKWPAILNSSASRSDDLNQAQHTSAPDS